MPTPPALQSRWFAVQDLFEANGWNVRSFDISNGWDFEKAAHRRAFHELQDLECPDFSWFAPPCKKWSTLQNLSLHTLAQIEALEAERDFQEATHLWLCSRGFMKQKREGRHAGLEQTRQHPGPVPVWHHAPGQLWRLDVHQEAHDAAMAFVSSCKGNDKALHGRLKPEDLQPSTSFWSLSTRPLQCHL